MKDRFVLTQFTDLGLDKSLLKAISRAIQVADLGLTVGEVLLAPTRIYVKPILKLLSEQPVHGMAQIVGRMVAA